MVVQGDFVGVFLLETKQLPTATESEVYLKYKLKDTKMLYKAEGKYRLLPFDLLLKYKY